MAYAVVLDALAADVHTQMVGRSMALAMGGEPAGQYVTWDVVRKAFDDHLLAPLEEDSPEVDDRSVLMRALGLR